MPLYHCSLATKEIFEYFLQTDDQNRNNRCDVMLRGNSFIDYRRSGDRCHRTSSDMKIFIFSRLQRLFNVFHIQFLTKQENNVRNWKNIRVSFSGRPEFLTRARERIQQDRIQSRTRRPANSIDMNEVVGRVKMKRSVDEFAESSGGARDVAHLETLLGRLENSARAIAGEGSGMPEVLEILFSIKAQKVF